MAGIQETKAGNGEKMNTREYEFDSVAEKAKAIVIAKRSYGIPKDSMKTESKTLIISVDKKYEAQFDKAVREVKEGIKSGRKANLEGDDAS